MRQLVKNHLKTTGYTPQTGMYITAFLLGAEVTSKDEKLEIAIGEHDFSDFYNWYEQINRYAEIELTPDSDNHSFRYIYGVTVLDTNVLM